MILIGLCVLIEVILTLGDLGWLSVVRLRATAYEYAGFWPGLLGSWTPNYLLQPYTMFASYAFFHSGLIRRATRAVVDGAR